MNLAKNALVLVGAAVIVGGVGYGAYSYSNLRKENRSLSSSLAEVRQVNTTLSLELGSTTQALNLLDGTIGNIASTVSTLEKLKNTDPELLKKYSKVYFLNENYVPKGLVGIDPEYHYDATKPLYFLSSATPFLNGLLSDASSTGLSLRIASAYRSFAEQSGLKSAYTVRYGSGANTFSADQGYSEHQLGTAVDFTTLGLKGGLAGFDKTPEYAWLTDNAYKYGFILSYPKNNSYYVYEPWHWRFVGLALAKRLHEERENFYDLDQRQIDPYLVSLFDAQ